MSTELAITNVSGWVTAGATVALVLATIVLAIFTWRLAKQSNQAQIIMTLHSNMWGINFLDIEVENTGNATAFDINVETIPELKPEDNNLRPLKHISVLKPGQKMTSYLGKYGDYQGKSFKVVTSWKRSPRATYFERLEYQISLSDYDNVTFLGDRDPNVLQATEIKKIRELLRPVLKGSQRLKVDEYNQSDRDNETAARQEHLEEMRRRHEGNSG